MPLLKASAHKAAPKKAIDYITREDKAAIVSSISLDDSRDYAEQFRETGEIFGKGHRSNERKYYHFKLSCDPADNPTPEQSHELATRLALEIFPNHECIIATHNDTDTIHTHIIVNAVNYETGLKLHLNKHEDYPACKDKANELGEEMGFTPLDWRKKTNEKFDRLDNGINVPIAISRTEEHINQRATQGTASWKDALRQAIDEAKTQCTSREEFEGYLQNTFGITMPRNTDKTVSFTHPAVINRNPVRGVKLGGNYTAESIDQALKENSERGMHHARLFTTTEQQPAPISSHRGAEYNGTDNAKQGNSPREHISETSTSGIQPRNTGASKEINAIRDGVKARTATGRSEAATAKLASESASREVEQQRRTLDEQQREISRTAGQKRSITER